MSTKWTEVCRLARREYRRRTSLKDLIHHKNKAAWVMYASMIEAAKKSHYEEFLESVDERMVWTAHQYVSGDPMDGSKARVPMLRVKQMDGTMQVAETNAEKGEGQVAARCFLPQARQ